MAIPNLKKIVINSGLGEAKIDKNVIDEPHFAQMKLPEARAAYQLALDKSEARSAYRTLIQVKLDALGAAR